MNAAKQTPLQRTVLAMVLLNAFTTPLMLSAVNVALPAIAADLKLNAVMLSWVPMAYLMASAVFVLVFGRIADLIGRKRVFLIGTTAVIVTSLLAACATNDLLLIGARFLQGSSAAMLYATQVAIVSSVFPTKQRGRAIGLTVSMIYLGLTCGPLVGGYCTELFGWRANFVLHIPLSITVLLIGLLKVPPEWSAEQSGELDVRGAIRYGLAIVLLCLGASTLPTLIGIMLLASGAFGLWHFFRLAHHTRHPIFDVGLFFSNRVFTLSCLASFIIYTAVFANVVLVSLYLQYLQGISAGTAGMIMMVQPLTMAVFSPFAGRLSDHVEPKIIASIGMLMTALGLILLALMDTAGSIIYLIVALAITGFGFSLFSSPNANAIMSAADRRHYGSAGGMLATMRILGQMSSMTLMALIFALVIGQVEITPSNYRNLEQAISICFAVSACLCVPGCIFSLARGQVHSLSRD